jgi:hypothetical protein
MGFSDAVFEELGNLTKMLNPYRAAEFFENMEIKPRNYMLKYVACLSLFMFVGYTLNLSTKQGFGGASVCPMQIAVEFALLACLSVISMVFLASIAITVFGKGFVGVNVTIDEMASVIGYSMSVVLISGIFSFHAQAIIIHWLGVIYSIVLLYFAASARYGLERAFLVFVFLLAAVLISFMLVYLGLSSAIGVAAGVLKTVGFYESDLPIRTIPDYCIVG